MVGRTEEVFESNEPKRYNVVKWLFYLIIIFILGKLLLWIFGLGAGMWSLGGIFGSIVGAMPGAFLICWFDNRRKQAVTREQ